MLYSVYAVNFR